MAYYGSDLVTAKLLAYTRRYGIREHAVLKQCRLETLKNQPDASMMTMPEEAAFLAFFIKTMNARRGLEIGVFTGYSSVSLALAMPEDSELLCLEVNQELADIARSYWRAAGVDHRVTCRVGDAVAGVNQLVEQGQSNTFDFAYIDANKERYDAYYEAALQLVRPSGVIIMDNMLWGGKVIDNDDNSEATQAIKNLNRKIHADSRVEMVLTTLGDGVTFARKL